MSGWLWLLLLALVGSAYFSGAETAVVSSGRLRQRDESDLGHRLARVAERVYRRRSQTLAVMLLGVNVFNVLASICALMLTEQALGALGLRLPVFWSDMISTLWITAVIFAIAALPTFLVLRERAIPMATPPGTS